MRPIVGWLGVILFVLVVSPAAAFAEEKTSDLYDCGEPKCSEWAPKGENTCRTCDTAQCRKRGNDELLVGNKKKSQCYEGHGAPPSEEELQD
jgi:uncharacterized membrane protein